jgi:hypothetical protein
MPTYEEMKSRARDPELFEKEYRMYYGEPPVEASDAGWFDLGPIGWKGHLLSVGAGIVGIPICIAACEAMNIKPTGQAGTALCGAAGAAIGWGGTQVVVRQVNKARGGEAFAYSEESEMVLM